MLKLILLLNLFLPFYINATTRVEKVSFSIVDEYYPSSSKVLFEGQERHAYGIAVSYSLKLTKNSGSKFEKYFLFNSDIKWEVNPEIYDSDRHSVSNESNLLLSLPVKNIKDIGNITYTVGADLNYNGPQYNDRHSVYATGLQLEKSLHLFNSPINIKLASLYAKYFYEVDDEPAFEQSGLNRKFLAHRGEGIVWKFLLNYQLGANYLNYQMTLLDANDILQKQENYKKKETKLIYGRQVNSQLDCNVSLSRITHEYHPKALSHKDELLLTKLSCASFF